MAIKYKWLAEILREWIDKSRDNGIDRLPTEMELCARYKVSRQTVRLTLSILEKEGLITKKHGSGSYITGLSRDGSKNSIPILITGQEEYFYPELIEDITGVLGSMGFSGEIFVTNNQVCLEREILLQLLENPPRGIIAEGCKSALPNPNLKLYQELIKKGTSLLFLHNYYPALTDSLYVKDDNLAGSELLIRHLALLGHTAIGGIFLSDDLQGTERYLGFLQASYALGLSVEDNRISWFHTGQLQRLQKKQDTRFLKAAIQEALKDCTAVVCYNDEIAYWLMKELLLAGYSLPRDMAIVSFDNTYLSNSDTLTITSLSHRPHEMGLTAAQMMVDRLKGLPVASREIPWTLIEKESSLT